MDATQFEKGTWGWRDGSTLAALPADPGSIASAPSGSSQPSVPQVKSNRWVWEPRSILLCSSSACFVGVTHSPTPWPVSLHEDCPRLNSKMVTYVQSSPWVSFWWLYWNRNWTTVSETEGWLGLFWAISAIIFQAMLLLPKGMAGIWTLGHPAISRKVAEVFVTRSIKLELPASVGI